MSVIAMMNFDNAVGGFSGTFNTPTNGTGFEPFIAPYGVSNQASAVAKEIIGVTGREADKMGGTNALVVWRNDTSVRPTLTIAPKNLPYMTGVDPFAYTVGFRFKVASENSSPTFQGADTILCISSVNTVLSTQSNGALTFFGSVTGITLTMDKEYYFEVKIEHAGGTPTGSYNPVFSLYVDGVFIMSRNVTAFTGGANRIFNVQLGIYRASLGSTSSRARWLFSDIYITDNKGDAPYNGPLGPQRVRMIVPDEVVSNPWALSNGESNPIPYLTGAGGRDDSIFLTAPDDDGEAKFRFAIPTTSKSVVNGITLFARAKRDDGASRALQGTIKKADGTDLNTVPASVLSSAFAPYLIGQYLPESAAQAANLKDSVLQAMEFGLKAPTA